MCRAPGDDLGLGRLAHIDTALRLSRLVGRRSTVVIVVLLGRQSCCLHQDPGQYQRNLLSLGLAQV